MDQQQVNLQRLRRDITYQVDDMHRSQRRRLNRLRDDLRSAPLPPEPLNRIFTDTAQHWEQAFAHLEQRLGAQGEHLLANGTDYHTLHTEFTRQSTTTLHALLDLPLSSGDLALCSGSDRMLRLTANAWTAITVIVILAAAVLAGVGFFTLAAAAAIMVGAVLSRAALEGLCLWRANANRDRLADLRTHLERVTAQVQAELNRLPDALRQAVEG